MDSIPDDLLELQARFDQWRANRKYNRESVPNQLRYAALEMSRRYPSSLLRQVLKIQLCRLMPKAKTNARRSKRKQPQTALFKLQPLFFQYKIYRIDHEEKFVSAGDFLRFIARSRRRRLGTNRPIR